MTPNFSRCDLMSAHIYIHFSHTAFTRMEAALDPVVLESSWGSLQAGLYESMTALLLYGIFLVLFVLASYLLAYRLDAPGRRYFIAITVAMFLFSTTQVVLHTTIALLAIRGVHHEIRGEPFIEEVFICKILFFAQDIVLVTNNLITDGLFTYRCYLVWGKNVYSTILPLCMLAATTAIGYVEAFRDDYHPFGSIITSRVAFDLSILTNVVLMCLTAGRIWWARKELRTILSDPAITRKYNTAIAMILESGAIYCATVVGVVLSEAFSSPSSHVYPMFRGAIAQVVNIAPTIIIVRVGLTQRVHCDSCKGPDSIPLRVRPARGSGDS
ncbi:hypothetical protein C8R44DRAFT_142822 [Mycena epipterygia]|nr:hypothetical protein C8R44DRAFT_142822 [Mycena epipterygia]